MYQETTGETFSICVCVYRNEIRWIVRRVLKCLGLLDSSRYHSRANCDGGPPRFVVNLSIPQYRKLSEAIYQTVTADGWSGGYEIYADEIVAHMYGDDYKSEIPE